MPDYAFVTRWYFPVPIDRVYTEIDHASAWPDWWRGVRKVEIREPGGPDKLGLVTRTTWRSKLPYDLTFDARTVRHDPPTGSPATAVIEVDAFGELEGHGRWEIVADPRGDGAGTRVSYHWNVATNKWWMNVFAPLLRPLFAWNHDTIMRWGGEGLAARLGTTLTEE